MQPHIAATLSILIYCLCCLQLTGCQPAPESPEAAVKAQLDRLETAIEEKDAKGVLSLVHENFGTRGNGDRKWLQRTLAFYMLRHNRLGVLRSSDSIQVDGISAQVDSRVVVSGGDGLVPDTGGIYDVISHWRLEDGDWLLIYAEWKRPG